MLGTKLDVAATVFYVVAAVVLAVVLIFFGDDACTVHVRVRSEPITTTTTSPR